MITKMSERRSSSFRHFTCPNAIIFKGQLMSDIKKYVRIEAEFRELKILKIDWRTILMLNTSTRKEFESGRIANIVPAKSRPNSRTAGTGVVTIINSQRNGKRVEISTKTMQRLGNPDFLEFGFADKCMVIGTGGLGDELRMKVTRSGSKGIVYNAGIGGHRTLETGFFR